MLFPNEINPGNIQSVKEFMEWSFSDSAWDLIPGSNYLGVYATDSDFLKNVLSNKLFFSGSKYIKMMPAHSSFFFSIWGGHDDLHWQCHLWAVPIITIRMFRDNSPCSSVDWFFFREHLFYNIIDRFWVSYMRMVYLELLCVCSYENVSSEWLTTEIWPHHLCLWYLWTTSEKYVVFAR